MKKGKVTLSLLLAFAMALASMLTQLHIYAADEIWVTAVSGAADSVKLTTSLSYETVSTAFAAGEMSGDLNQAPAMTISGVEQSDDGNAVIVLTPDAAFTAGAYYALYADSAITVSDQTMTLGQNYFFCFDGSSWSFSDITDSVYFENEGAELFFTGIGADQDASIGRVSYNDAGVDSREGSYALKVSHSSHYYPTFQLNFGTTLPADTVITFDVYGTFDGWTSGNDMNIEFTGTSGSGQVVYMIPETWFTATITLTEETDHLQFFYNIERNNGISGDVASYILIDNLKTEDLSEPETTEPETTEPETTEPEAVGDIEDGYGFEADGNALWFEGVGGDNAWRDAAFTVTEIDGDNALKLTCASSQWPTFRLNFGKTLSAGTVITFDAYTNDTSGIRNTVSIFEYVSGGEATAQYYHGQWSTLGITLTSDCDYIDLMCNMDRWNEPGSANLEVYLDNFKATSYTPTGDIQEGYGFEEAGNVGYFTGSGENGAVVQRVQYSQMNIGAAENGGTYALKMSHPSHLWPEFRIDFGTTLQSGTEISFYIYVKINGEISKEYCELAFVDSKDTAAGIVPGQWSKVTVTLPAEQSYVDLFWNVDLAGVSGDMSSEVYIDNILAKDPDAPVGDILEGYGFDVAGNERFFADVGGDQAWRDATFTVTEFDGDNALKLTCASSQWPTFRFNFGRTLRKGSVITFDAYTNDTSGIRSTVSIFEYMSGDEATAQYYHGSWNTLTITLTEETDHLDLVCNMDRWDEPGSANLEVYIDNVKAVQPPVGDIWEGYGFEVDGNELWFEGVGGDNAWRDATLKVTHYANTGITANGGNYTLKLTCASSQWPTFRLNFGQTLPAGTIVAFDAYTNDTSGIRNTVSIFEYVSGGVATAQYYHGSWNTLTITLTEETDHLDLMCNMDRWNEPGSANLEVYLDNFKAHSPGAEQKENVVDPDCVNEGSYEAVIICTHCGVELSREVKTVEALGHTEVIDAAVPATCTETGLTEGKHCSVCNTVTVPQETVDVLSHSFDTPVVESKTTNGGMQYYSIVHTCSGCSTTETVADLRFVSANIQLGNTFIVDFKAPANVLGDGEGFTDVKATYTYGNRVGEYAIVSNLDVNNINSDGKYILPCTMITPSQIGDEITAVLSGVYNGVTYECTMTYSVKDYCYNILSASTDTTVKTLLVDLLNYCDAARTYTTYKADESVTADLTDEQKAYATTAVPALDSVADINYQVCENASVSWQAVGLILTDSISMRFRFAAESVENLTVKVKIGDVETAFDQSSFVSAGDGHYYLRFNGIKGNQMREPVYVTVYSGETQVSNTLRYSVESYACKYQNDAKLGELVLAMMRYGDSADQYL